MEEVKNGVKRKLDELGRMVIPIDLRRQIGAKEGDTFLIRQCGPFTLELELVPEDRCLFCDAREHLVTTSYGFLCRNCLSKLMASVHEQMELLPTGEKSEDPAKNTLE